MRRAISSSTKNRSENLMHAALDINIPNYASAIVNTNEIVASIPSL
jgi:hypothetical protein